MKDYGVDHHYTYVMGANGGGTIMYADTSLNVTDDFIKYINQKYEE